MDYRLAVMISCVFAIGSIPGYNQLIERLKQMKSATPPTEPLAKAVASLEHTVLMCSVVAFELVYVCIAMYLLRLAQNMVW